jgi:hypothetical protein
VGNGPPGLSRSPNNLCPTYVSTTELTRLSSSLMVGLALHTSIMYLVRVTPVRSHTCTHTPWSHELGYLRRDILPT